MEFLRHSSFPASILTHRTRKAICFDERSNGQVRVFEFIFVLFFRGAFSIDSVDVFLGMIEDRSEKFIYNKIHFFQDFSKETSPENVKSFSLSHLFYTFFPPPTSKTLDKFTFWSSEKLLFNKHTKHSLYPIMTESNNKKKKTFSWKYKRNFSKFKNGNFTWNDLESETFGIFPIFAKVFALFTKF